MNKKGFVVTSVLYPITILVTGVTAVFLSTTKTNNVINGMKLDVNSSVFDSVTCDCEAINKAIKTHSEKIKTIENTIEKVQTNIDSLRDYLNYGNAKANEILSGKTVLGIAGTATNDATASASQILSGQTAYVKGQKVIGTMAKFYPFQDLIQPIVYFVLFGKKHPMRMGYLILFRVESLVLRYLT